MIDEWETYSTAGVFTLNGTKTRSNRLFVLCSVTKHENIYLYIRNFKVTKGITKGSFVYVLIVNNSHSYHYFEDISISVFTNYLTEYL